MQVRHHDLVPIEDVRFFDHFLLLVERQFEQVGELVDHFPEGVAICQFQFHVLRIFFRQKFGELLVGVH